MAHIKDLTETHPLKSIGSPAFTTEKQVFHTDKGDIISLFVLQTATEGGLSRISSSWRVYNELAETRPDLIKTLSEPWNLDAYEYSCPPISSLILLRFRPQVRRRSSLRIAPSSVLERPPYYHTVREASVYRIPRPSALSRYPSYYRSTGGSTRHIAFSR